MDISARTDYAIRALLSLCAAHAGGGAAVSAETLAVEQDLPRKFLEAILADLRRGGLVVSQRGSAGGYRLAVPADELTLGMVVRTVDGPLAEVRGLRPHQTAYEGAAQHLPVVWVALRASMRHVLDEVTLADLVSGQLPAHVRGLAEEPGAWLAR